MPIPGFCSPVYCHGAVCIEQHQVEAGLIRVNAPAGYLPDLHEIGPRTVTVCVCLATAVAASHCQA